LEIINKYSPETIDPYLKLKISLLKADILGETEDYDSALEELEQISHQSTSINDKDKRLLLQGEARKIKGKILYYINEWEQSEENFKEAEKFFSLANDHSGLAAVYNNLAVLYMFQGDWDRSEQYFLKSLALEKEHFNLNGISICW